MNVSAERIRAAHAHAALLAALHGESHPAFLLVFERLEEAVRDLDSRQDVLARARVIAAQRHAA